MLLLLGYGGFFVFLILLVFGIETASGKLIISGIICLCVSLLSIFSLSIISESRYEEVFQTYTYELLPISEDDENPEQTCYVYVPIKNDKIMSYCCTYYDGGVKFDSISANGNVTIEQDNTYTPHIVKNIVCIKYRIDDSLLAFLTFGLITQNETKEAYEIYAPAKYFLMATE